MALASCYNHLTSSHFAFFTYDKLEVKQFSISNAEYSVFYSTFNNVIYSVRYNIYCIGNLRWP
uniref:Uncharacterized protein n=1 Tax=Cajanus cajan TaxID=3821 RepID=A0A151S3P0_CAJCA|nr:hypothetical protein KK1_028927 [Cajanus cajan]